MKCDINSIWTRETGRWNGKDYVDRKVSDPVEKIIQMEIVDHGGISPVLQFRGGPTGYESYHVQSFKDRPPKADWFCICAGTINSWSCCKVETKKVLEFIAESESV